MDGQDSSQPPAGAGDQTTEEIYLDLKILSPSSEIPPAGLQLEHLAASMNVGELRDRITAAIPSRPPPERQRLIYLGRVLQQDNVTLASLFGDVSQSRQHTLHLVLRDSQTPIAPSTSTVPRPAAIYPTSSIPRPSSVPPRASGAASPFRPANWPSQPSPQGSAPTSATTTPQRLSQAVQPPPEQPQVRAQTPNNPSVTRASIGNTHAQIRANVTANGVPVNLPPEIINQLLNQHLFRNGVLDPFGNPQIRPQVPDQGPPSRTPPPIGVTPPPPQTFGSNNPFQRSVASPEGTMQQGDRTGDSADFADRESRGRSTEQEPTARESRSASQANIPAHANSDPARQSTPLNQNQTPGPQGPRTITQGGITPDGVRWATTTITTDGPIAGLPQMPIMQPGALPFPQGFPMPMLPMQAGGMPIPMAAPVAGLRPQAGTPRSASPARSVSEGPRRVGTPALELQHRLMHTNREIENLNQLLGVVAGGTMANGQAAPPLSEEQLSQIRAFANSMNSHIDGFGNDLNALAAAAPAVRFQPEYAALHSVFQAVQAQGRAMSNRVDNLNGSAAQQPPTQARVGGTDGSHSPLNGQTAPHIPRSTHPTSQANSLPAISTTPPVQPNTHSHVNPGRDRTSVRATEMDPNIQLHLTSALNALAQLNDTPQADPARQVDPVPQVTSTLQVNPATQTNAVTGNNPTTPELHLLTDPTGTQHYLLIGPNGPLGTGYLPLDVIYPLLAAQLPHDQLVRDFNRATRSTLQALQRYDIGLRRSTTTPTPSQQRQSASVQAAPGTAPGPAPAPAAGIAGGPPQQPRAGQLAQAANALLPDNRGRNGQAQAAAAAAPPDEMRDILAPIIRNLWLIIRIIGFGYFFLSSGRGYGRLVILGILGGFVWALNAGMLGRQVGGAWEGLRRHFEALVDEARGRQRPEVPAAPQGNGEGSSAAAARQPNPEDTARRLLAQRAEGQRRRFRDVLRQIERTIALCVASLWPGVGEAVVRNLERAQQEADRAAELERSRLAVEEADKRLEEARKEVEEYEKAQGVGEEAKDSAEAGKHTTNLGSSTLGEAGADAGSSSGNDAGSGEGVGRVNKGKERVVD